jgi:hypothetical protein
MKHKHLIPTLSGIIIGCCLETRFMCHFVSKSFMSKSNKLRRRWKSLWEKEKDILGKRRFLCDVQNPGNVGCTGDCLMERLLVSVPLGISVLCRTLIDYVGNSWLRGLPSRLTFDLAQTLLCCDIYGCIQNIQTFIIINKTIMHHINITRYILLFLFLWCFFPRIYISLYLFNCAFRGKLR